MCSKLIIDSVTNHFWKRESTEPMGIELQRRTSLTSDVVVTHDKKPQETSLNSIENSQTKVIFSENHYAEHETNHATLDMSCNNDKIKLQ